MPFVVLLHLFETCRTTLWCRHAKDLHNNLFSIHLLAILTTELMFSWYFYSNSKVSFLSHNIYLRTPRHAYSLGCFPYCALFCIHWHSVSSVILLSSHSVAEMLLQLFGVGFFFNYLSNSGSIISSAYFRTPSWNNLWYIKLYGSSKLVLHQ